MVVFAYTRIGDAMRWCENLASDRARAAWVAEQMRADPFVAWFVRADGSSEQRVVERRRHWSLPVPMAKRYRVLSGEEVRPESVPISRVDFTAQKYSVHIDDPVTGIDDTLSTWVFVDDRSDSAVRQVAAALASRDLFRLAQARGVDDRTAASVLRL